MTNVVQLILDKNDSYELGLCSKSNSYSTTNVVQTILEKKDFSESNPYSTTNTIQTILERMTLMSQFFAVNQIQTA